MVNSRVQTGSAGGERASHPALYRTRVQLLEVLQARDPPGSLAGSPVGRGLPAFWCPRVRGENGAMGLQVVPQKLGLPGGNSADGRGTPSTWTHEGVERSSLATTATAAIRGLGGRADSIPPHQVDNAICRARCRKKSCGRFLLVAVALRDQCIRPGQHRARLAHRRGGGTGRSLHRRRFGWLARRGDCAG